MPAVPGATDAFVVAAVDPPRDLVLTVPDGRGGTPSHGNTFLTRCQAAERGSSCEDARRRTGSTSLARRRLPSSAHLHRARVCGAGEASASAAHRLRASGHRIMEARHLRGIQRRSTAARPRRRLSHEAWRKALLVCGIASSLLYAAMIWGIRYEGYSPISQVPSELTAIGAPTRTVVGAAGANLHPAGRRLWVGHLGIRRTKSRRAHRRRPDSGLRISWAPVAVCADAPTGRAGRRRGHVKRHACTSRSVA